MIEEGEKKERLNTWTEHYMEKEMFDSISHAQNLAEHEIKIADGDYDPEFAEKLDPNKSYIDLDARGATDSITGNIAIKTDEEDYQDGMVYLDVVTGKFYKKQGAIFIPYEEDAKDITLE